MDYLKSASREAYEHIQISASTAKMGYCKFSYRDAAHYLDLIRDDKRRRKEDGIGDVLALGVRNGREVDCFRIAKRGSRLRRWLVRTLERRAGGFVSRLPWLEAFDRGGKTVDQHDCVGVELNPLARRDDVWVGSFDQLPESWTGRFDVAYTNAFDHAYDPDLAAACWRRVLRPGGYFVLAFPTDQDAAPIDPVGKVSLDDVRRLFPGELIYYRLRGSAWQYTEYIIRLT